jgi:hypothetical protein
VHGCAEEVVSLLSSGEVDLILVGGICHDLVYSSVHKYMLNAVNDTPCVLIQEYGGEFEEIWHYQELNFIAKFRRSKRPHNDGYPISYAVLEELLVYRHNRNKDIFFSGRKSDYREEIANYLAKMGYDGISL